MFKIIAVSNRHLCKGDFFKQIEKICRNPRINTLVLREKDLSPEEYAALSEKIIKIYSEYNQELILHKFLDTAIKLDFPNIHLSVPGMIQYSNKLKFFKKVGVSVHSIKQVQIANNFYVDYLFAGHIFKTDCKKDSAPRGLGFLRDVVATSQCPVYAIGGINKNNIDDVIKTGAHGACIMSGAMAEKIDI